LFRRTFGAQIGFHSVVFVWASGDDGWQVGTSPGHSSVAETASGIAHEKTISVLMRSSVMLSGRSQAGNSERCMSTQGFQPGPGDGLTKWMASLILSG